MTDKTLDITDTEGAKANIEDLKVFGNGDLFRLVSKASSKKGGWMKSTKACEIKGVGCIVQVTTQQGKQVAEALTFVPNVELVEDSEGHLRFQGIPVYQLRYAANEAPEPGYEVS
jgi:hypothetical protein